jgi:hypothetical protein
MHQETLGQIFKRYRLEARKKIEQVENDTKISQRMILAVENDNFLLIPDDLYGRNIIKTYAQYLGLDFNRLLTIYDEARGKVNASKQKIEESQKVKVYLTPQRTRNILIIFGISILIGYFAWQISQIYQPPVLVVSQPDKNLITSESFIEVKGQTEKEARVYINGKEVFLDSLGNFKADLDLQKGLNLLKISAAKKHSKESVIYREVLVQ